MSSFVWIDHSEKQRRQVLEAIDLFKERDTRDELGTGGIRDAFSDMLFPGTGALQTRARYFFFIPWMYRQFEERKVSAAEIARKAKDVEVALIYSLCESPDPKGTIGLEAKEGLARFPASVYWNGLRVLRLCQFDGSQAQYHRSLDKFYSSRGRARVNDDCEPIDSKIANWHQAIPEPPSEFPKGTSFAMRPTEARFLRELVKEHHPRSLFAWLLDRPLPEADVDFAWELPGITDVGLELARKLEHARCFSEVQHGAAILYNLFLGEQEPVRPKIVEDREQQFNAWLQLMADRREAHRAWSLTDFWLLLDSQKAGPTWTTRQFVEAWHSLVVKANPKAARSSSEALQLIRNREQDIKGPGLARFCQRRKREMWQGDAGLRRLSYRWSNALIILRDIQSGLGQAHA